MAIFDQGDKLQKWKYTIKNVSVSFSDTSSISIPTERVSQIDIEENYEEYYFPLIKLTLVLESSIYYKILKDKLNCKFNIRVDRYYQTIDSSDKSLNKIFINDSFSLIMDDGTDDMLSALDEEENKQDYKSRKASDINELDDVDNVVTFYLFKSSISGTKINVNKILCNANVSDAIAYLVTVGKLGKVLMSQPDNVKVYKELLIPNMSILKAFAFIDTYYGLYKSGSVIWFGIDHIYIGPFNGSGNAFKANEIQNTNIIIPKSANSEYTTSLGSLKKVNDNKSNYIVGNYSSLNIENQSISNDYLNANSIQIVDSYDDMTVSSNSTATSKNGNFTKIFINKTENDFISEMYTAQTNAKSVVVTVKLQDYDVSAIAPNKKFNMIFQDPNYTKKYNGNYTVAGVAHTFIKEGIDFGVSSTLILRKTK